MLPDVNDSMWIALGQVGVDNLTRADLARSTSSIYMMITLTKTLTTIGNWNNRKFSTPKVPLALRNFLRQQILWASCS